MNENKIAFIYCVNDEELFEESVRYVRSLNVPDKMEVEIIPIRDAASICAGYNKGMKQTDAKYKVYLHQDTFIINANFIADSLNIFKADRKIGMMGVIGSETMPLDGIWWDSQEKIGEVFDSHTGKIELLKFGTEIQDYTKVQAIDGLIMITQYDLKWRSDFLKGWHLYDVVQSFEFTLKGYKVVVPKQRKPWCLHDCGPILLEDSYYESKKIFCEKYLAEEKSAHFFEDNPILSICIPTYNRQTEIEKSILSIVSQIKDNRIEVIISDNASDDNTGNIVKKYCEKYSFIKYFRNSENLGSEKNIINSINQASGKYILLHGDDDYFKNGTLSKLLNLMINNPHISLFFLDVLNDKKDLIFDSGLSNYLKRTSIYSTFMSSIAFRKAEYEKIDDPELFLGSFINQVYLQYAILKINPNFCVLRESFFDQEGNEIIGYNYGEVFIKNYLEILNYFIGISEKDFITLESIKMEKKKMLETTLFYWYRYIVRNNPPVEFDNFDEIFEQYYKDESYYNEAKDIFKQIKLEEKELKLF